MIFRFVLVIAVLGGIGLSFLLSGCTTPHAPAAKTEDRAFIDYWPPKPDERRLRVAIKDNMDVKGYVTTAGSAYFAKEAKRATKDAECVRRARARGVVFVGKTNLSEFALGTSGMNEYFGTPINPIDKARIPGGSSSGAAVSVANGEADIAFGTDTAGSIRVPAACCGVYGLKTTFGLVPEDGVVPISASHLDTIGPLAKDLPNLVRGMDLLKPGFAAEYHAATNTHASAAAIKVGRLYVDGTDRAIDRAVDKALADAGFQVVRLDDRFKAAFEVAREKGITVAVTEGWMDNRPFLNYAGVSLPSKAAITLGSVKYKTDYKEALATRVVWQAILRDTFRHVDFIALPTLKRTPPRIPFLTRSVLFEQRTTSQQNTVPANLAGVPAVAMPIPLRRHFFPVTSLQLMGPPHSEAALLNAVRLVEARAL